VIAIFGIIRVTLCGDLTCVDFAQFSSADGLVDSHCEGLVSSPYMGLGKLVDSFPTNGSTACAGFQS